MRDSRVARLCALLLVAAWPAVAAAQDQPRYRKLRVVEALRGHGEGQVREELRGLTIGPDGHIYTVGDQRLLVLTADGRLLRHWATARPGYGVTVGSDGRVYVGEPGQVEVFGADGRLIETWRDPEHLELITSIAVTDAEVLCGDARGRCIRRLDRHGKYLGDIGKGAGLRGFMLPNGHLDFAVDRQGRIYAANSGRHRVEVYTLAGEPRGHFGRFDSNDPAAFTGCCNPTNVALTPAGEIAVVTKAPPAVKVYNAGGGLLAALGADDLDPNCKNSDVAVDARGRIYVIDTVRLQIVVYEPLPAPATQATETQP